ncbi:hypothetical protein QTP86_018088, partial [Hemibagrus guttatus]
MNTGKQQKPVLTGQRFKTRKRDEKEKFEPTVFRDTIIQGLNEAGGDLDAVAKFLDVTGSRLDYRRYADTLFDLLIAGSMLAPGGTRIDDGDKTKVTVHCVFTTEENHTAVRSYAQVFNKLIRRYKYLEKAFEEEIKKLLLFLKAFTESEQAKLAMLTGILLATGTLPPAILTSLFSDNIVKEGIAASFAVKLFKAWIAEKDANAVTSALRKASLDKKLLELFPANKQNVEHFSMYFNEAGLKELSDFLRVQQTLGTRKELQKELQERLSQECPIREIVVYVKEEMKRNDLQEQAVIGLLWSCLMNAVEWNKKEELVTEQAIKHLKHYAPLLAVFSTQGQSELVLLLKIQEYCYDNIHFMKSFSKIVVLFYKVEAFGINRNLLVSTGDIVGWWKEYFEDLLNPTDTPSDEEPEAEDSEVDSFITQAEVTEVVQQLLGGKAPGVDEIRPEYLKSLDVVGLSWLTRLCNIAWRSGTVPLDWATGVVVPLFKKGDRRVCSNYRGITLLSLPGKVYSRVLERRVRPVLEGSWEFAQPVHMCFVDLEKAFDRVPRGILWEVLWEYGVRGPLLRAVRSLYNRSRSLVRIASYDVVLLASSSLDIQHALGRFAAECEAAGMRVSSSKSEAMVLDRKKVVCTLQVGGEVLPQVEEFKYLGVLFTSEGRMDRENDRRIGAAAAVMRSMYWSVVMKKELSQKAKLSIYQSIYVPTLTYGHELWVMTERISSRTVRRELHGMGIHGRAAASTPYITNVNLVESFHKRDEASIAAKADVLSEEAILKWYKDAHAAKGKSVFLEQMKKFVEWLQNAEEESESER